MLPSFFEFCSRVCDGSSSVKLIDDKDLVIEVNQHENTVTTFYAVNMHKPEIGALVPFINDYEDVTKIQISIRRAFHISSDAYRILAAAMDRIKKRAFVNMFFHAIPENYQSNPFTMYFSMSLLIFAKLLENARSAYVCLNPTWGSVMAQLCYRDRLALSLVCREKLAIFRSDQKIHYLITRMRALFNTRYKLYDLANPIRPRSPDFLYDCITNAGDIFELAEWYCSTPSPRYLCNFANRGVNTAPSRTRKQPDSSEKRESKAKRVKISSN